MPYISFSFLIALARTSNTMLNKSEIVNNLVLFLIFKEKLLAFHPWIWLVKSMDLLYMTFIVLKYISSILTLLNIFIVNGSQICQMLFCICWDDHMIFSLHFVNVVYHIDWFADVEPFLHLWNKSHLIMVYDFFKCVV